MGGKQVDVMHTRGHTIGHSCFVFPDTNEVLTGDALLPHCTPNVGGADVRVRAPLMQYIMT